MGGRSVRYPDNVEIISYRGACFLVLLVLLLVSRGMTILCDPLIRDTAIHYNHFIATMLSRGLPPDPVLFKLGVVISGWGHFWYALLAVPFVAAIGEYFFATRTASLVFTSTFFIFLCWFCLRYLGPRRALVAALLFTLAPYLVHHASTVGEGRHFHYGLFTLWLAHHLLQTSVRGRISDYLFMGLAGAVGILWYPAFLVTCGAALGTLVLWSRERAPRLVWGCIGMLVCWAVACQLLAPFTPISGWSQLSGFFLGRSQATSFPGLGSIALRLLEVVGLEVPMLFGPGGASAFWGGEFTSVLHGGPKVAPGLVLHIVPGILCFFIALGHAISKVIGLRKRVLPGKPGERPERLVACYLLLNCSAWIVAYAWFYPVPTPRYLQALVVDWVLLLAMAWGELHRRWPRGAVLYLLGAVSAGLVTQVDLIKEYKATGICAEFVEVAYDHRCTWELFMEKSAEEQWRMLEVFPPQVAATLGRFAFHEPGTFDSLRRRLVAGLDVEVAERLVEGYCDMHYASTRRVPETFPFEFGRQRYNAACWRGIGLQLFHVYLGIPDEFRLEPEHADPSVVENAVRLFLVEYPGTFVPALCTGVGVALARLMHWEEYNPRATSEKVFVVLHACAARFSWNSACGEAFLAGATWETLQRVY